MTVLSIIKKVRARASALGIKSDLVNEPLLIELINEAIGEFTKETKTNLKHVKADSIADREYYDLPPDFLSPKYIKINGIPVEIISLTNYYDYKFKNS